MSESVYQDRDQETVRRAYEFFTFNTAAPYPYTEAPELSVPQITNQSTSTSTSTDSQRTTFLLFHLLPAELRLKILTYASLPPITPSKVHLIGPNPHHWSTLISNQAPSPLLSTSSLTRSVYLSTTSSIPAFNTYVSFPTDTFYFTPHTNHNQLNSTSLTALLSCEDTRHIKKFAVRRDVFDRSHREIFEGMEGLEELCVVLRDWRDWRPIREAWMATGVGFKKIEHCEEKRLMGSGEAHTEYTLKMCRQRYSEGGLIEEKAARYHEWGPVRIRLVLVE
ncbi:hypothetical protein WAI453_010550 [Rhynchosporium graminicola]